MEDKFRFDQAKEAVSFIFSQNPTKTIDEKLVEAKKVYDFLTGLSHHFENDETKIL